jgi:hypothetical protein
VTFEWKDHEAIDEAACQVLSAKSAEECFGSSGTDDTDGWAPDDFAIGVGFRGCMNVAPSVVALF